MNSDFEFKWSNREINYFIKQKKKKYNFKTKVTGGVLLFTKNKINLSRCVFCGSEPNENTGLFCEFVNDANMENHANTTGKFPKNMHQSCSVLLDDTTKKTEYISKKEKETKKIESF